MKSLIAKGNLIMSHRHLLSSLVCLLLMTATVSATSVSQIKPIQDLAGAKPNLAFLNDAGWDAPIVLRNKKDLARYFAKDELDKMMAKVDLKKQVVLIFAWRGSGGDRLSYDVLESFPEQIVFKLKPGRTKDLPQHVHVFALQSNVKWSVK